LGVTLPIRGIYHLNPSLDKAGAARIQVWIWIVGTTTETIGIGLVYTGHEAAEPMIAVGSLTLFAAMLIFGWLVFQCERDRRRQSNAILTASPGVEQERFKTRGTTPNSKVDGDRSSAWLRYASSKDGSHPLWSPCPR
jgi:hypothetical protein